MFLLKNNNNKPTWSAYYISVNHVLFRSIEVLCKYIF